MDPAVAVLDRTDRAPPFLCRDGGGAFRYDREPMDGDHTDWAAQDWEDLVPRLLLLAISRLSRMTWRGRRSGTLPGAAQAEDFVHDSISKTMGGVRVWNPNACTLFQHLAGVIVSDISHAATSSENRSTMAAPSNPGIGTGWPPDAADSAPDPEHAAVWRSEQRRLLDHLAGLDPVLGRMAELMLVHDLRESDGLSRELGIAASDVANLRKRMKRAVRAYLVEDGS